VTSCEVYTDCRSSRACLVFSRTDSKAKFRLLRAVYAASLAAWATATVSPVDLETRSIALFNWA
jgi:hypothetical protein